MYTKSLRWLILAVVLLLMSSLACNGAAILDGEEQSSGNLSPATGNTIEVQARDFSFSLDAITALSLIHI